MRDYTTPAENVPVCYILKPTNEISHYTDTGVIALYCALKRACIDVDDRDTVELLSKLQNAYDMFGTRGWREYLQSTVRQFGLNDALADTS